MYMVTIAPRSDRCSVITDVGREKNTKCIFMKKNTAKNKMIGGWKSIKEHFHK